MGGGGGVDPLLSFIVLKIKSNKTFFLWGEGSRGNFLGMVEVHCPPIVMNLP